MCRDPVSASERADKKLYTSVERLFRKYLTRPSSSTVAENTKLHLDIHFGKKTQPINFKRGDKLLTITFLFQVSQQQTHSLRRKTRDNSEFLTVGDAIRQQCTEAYVHLQDIAVLRQSVSLELVVSRYIAKTPVIKKKNLKFTESSTNGTI